VDKCHFEHTNRKKLRGNFYELSTGGNMKTIWKYELDSPDCTLHMNTGSKVLTVQMQGNKVNLWAIVDSHDGVIKSRRFLIIGTGQEMPSIECEYLATVQQANGLLVWHIFEVRA